MQHVSNSRRLSPNGVERTLERIAGMADDEVARAQLGLIGLEMQDRSPDARRAVEWGIVALSEIGECPGLISAHGGGLLVIPAGGSR